MGYIEVNEIIPETTFAKGVRRLKLGVAEKSRGQLSFGNVGKLLEELNSHADHPAQGTSEVETIAWKMVRDHTLACGGEIALKPSDFHRDTFLRDAAFVYQFARLPLLGKFILDMFAQTQDVETGQMPTSRFAFGRGGFKFPDESTFYYPILAYQQQIEGGIALSDVQFKAAKQALQFIVNDIDQSSGFVRNTAARRTYWPDELVLPGSNDVVSCKQGLSVPAFEAGYRLGIFKNNDLARRASDGYRKLARRWDDRLPLSLATGWRDVSALLGEAWHWGLFGKGLLDDSTVRNTLLSFIPYVSTEDKSVVGLRIITDQEGNYLPEAYFVHPEASGRFMDKPGKYQNGGDWRLFDYYASAAANFHRIDLTKFPENLRRALDGDYLIHQTFNVEKCREFSRTADVSDGEAGSDSVRVNQVWHVAMLDMRRRLDKFRAA